MDKTEEKNLEILELNKELLEHNKRVTLQNEQMAKDEHLAKMELFNYQKMKFVQEWEETTEPAALKAVSKFHRLFGHPVLDKPQIPDAKSVKLIIALIAEEFQELQDAFEAGDLVEVADAFADIEYVLNGGILRCGLGSRFKELFDEVQRSNMSKGCATEEEAKATIAWYKENKGVEASYIAKDGMFIVTRDEDNKALKSVNYSPADLKPILEG